MKKELWERDSNSLPHEKEVKPIRLRHKTKAQLVAKFRGGSQKVSPKLDTEVREGADDVTEGITYEIVNVEEITTDVQSLSGIRVSLQDLKGIEGNVMLWKRKVTGTGSKLGVFITKLGNDTDKWLHKWVKFDVWQDRKREIEVVPAPMPKVAGSKKGKAT